MWNDVIPFIHKQYSISILLITNRHSLFLLSYIRIPFGISYDLLTCFKTGEIRTYHVSHTITEWVRFRLYTGSALFAYPQKVGGYPTAFHFGLKPVSIFGFFNITMFYRRFAYANHTIQAKLPNHMILVIIVFPSRFRLLLSEGLPCQDSLIHKYYY